MFTGQIEARQVPHKDSNCHYSKILQKEHCPWPQQPHQLQGNLPPTLLEKHLLTVSLSQGAYEHTSICNPSPGLAAALELFFSSRYPHDHHGENMSS